MVWKRLCGCKAWQAINRFSERLTVWVDTHWQTVTYSVVPLKMSWCVAITDRETVRQSLDIKADIWWMTLLFGSFYFRTTTVWVSVLNLLLVYPAWSKWKYYASEADCRRVAVIWSWLPHKHEVSLSQHARTHLSLSLSLSLSAFALFSERLNGAALSVKTLICCFSNFTCKYCRNHSTAIVFILCVAYLIFSDNSSIINQDFWAD